MNDKIQLINIPIIFLICFLIISFILVNYDFLTRIKIKKTKSNFICMKPLI